MYQFTFTLSDDDANKLLNTITGAVFTSRASAGDLVEKEPELSDAFIQDAEKLENILEIVLASRRRMVSVVVSLPSYRVTKRFDHVLTDDEIRNWVINVTRQPIYNDNIVTQDDIKGGKIRVFRVENEFYGIKDEVAR